ncbi:NACHT domain-containing protein [Streptomyces sp. NPDC016566]|uniref:NACHT domain-containing protein n=1 Tax=Streptomyces sp. NPDC016566 TaxID=3364967 RepID=UPI003702078B
MEAADWRELGEINLNYTLDVAHSPGGATVPWPEGQLFEDGAATVPGIAAFFRGTHPSRLVVTGAPGAGKTVLVLELLLALIQGRAADSPVPVRMALPDWNSTTTPSLKDFVVDHLVQKLGWSARDARQLVDAGKVLPVLDGLDERDPTVLDAAGAPVPNPRAPRARAALDLLNQYQLGPDPGPLVLTCRRDHYEALPPQDRLLTAALVRIHHVDPGDAAGYLRRRSGGDDRWSPLLDHLSSEPDGALAEALSTPWRLSLVATVYGDTGDPAELIGVCSSPTDLDNHLLGHLIPAVVQAIPSPRFHRYTSEDVQRWLAYLARVPRPEGGEAAGNAPEGSDLVLHRLRLAGRRMALVDGVLSALLVLLAIPLAWTPSHPFLSAGMIAGIAALSVLLAVRSPHDPQRIHWKGRAQRRSGRSAGRGGERRSRSSQATAGLKLMVWFICGSVFFAVLGELFSRQVARWVLVGLLVFMLAVALWPTDRPEEAVGPRDLIRGNLRLALNYGVMAGLLVEIVVKAVTGGTFGVALGLAVGLFVGSWVGYPSRQYAAFLICAGGNLPLRLGVFADWARDAGLLRLSGPAHQFRHRELQQWLSHQQLSARGRRA